MASVLRPNAGPIHRFVFARLDSASASSVPVQQPLQLAVNELTRYVARTSRCAAVFPQCGLDRI